MHTIIHSAITFLEYFEKCVHPLNTFTVIFLTKIMAWGNKNHLDYEVIKSFRKVGSAQKFNKLRGLAFRTSKPIDACLKYNKLITNWQKSRSGSQKMVQQNGCSWISSLPTFSYSKFNFHSRNSI